MLKKKKKKAVTFAKDEGHQAAARGRVDPPPPASATASLGTEMDLVASSMYIASYEDMNRLEKEIARLLQCSGSRAPACLASESYQRFRQNILCMMMLHPGVGEAAAGFIKSLPLEQGLSVRIVNGHSHQLPLHVQLVWKEACSPAAPLEMRLASSSSSSCSRVASKRIC